jgi:glycosyltransferase involved in cell wall biosynthesis
VTLAGYVNDIGALIASSAVSLAPLWSGGGTRLKILEAMAIGTPVVATSKGTEGLDARNEEDLLIADTPEHFADGVTRLLRDPKLHSHISSNARRLVMEKYDWMGVMPGLLSLIERVSGV